MLIMAVLMAAGFPLISHAEASDETEETWKNHIADEFEGGEGSKENPYLIKTAEQLARMVYETKDGYFKLTEDIDLSQYCWKTEPMVEEYEMNLDGDGHYHNHLQGRRIFY